VAPDAKLEARDRVCEAAASGAYGHREIAIRANGLDTTWGPDDIRAAAAAGPDAVLVPKVSSVDDIATIERLLTEGGAPERTRIWAMLETPAGILNAADICASSERLAVLVMGTNDITKELHAIHVPGREPLLYSLSHCLIAARAAGKVILDGVYNDIKNEDGFAAECEQGARMGFDGKTLIHPSQLEPCNRIFAPSDDEIEQSRKVIEAWDTARAEGKGVVTVDGRMIENLHVDNARRVLAVAEAIAAQG
jgi:citrate lyase subunit beta/citryl-CoA lyase